MSNMSLPSDGDKLPSAWWPAAETVGCNGNALVLEGTNGDFFKSFIKRSLCPSTSQTYADLQHFSSRRKLQWRESPATAICCPKRSLTTRFRTTAASAIPIHSANTEHTTVLRTAPAFPLVCSTSVVASKVPSSFRSLISTKRQILFSRSYRVSSQATKTTKRPLTSSRSLELCCLLISAFKSTCSSRSSQQSERTAFSDQAHIQLCG